MISIGSKLIVVTPTISTSAYTSGDQLGSLEEIPSAIHRGQGHLESITLVDKAKRNVALDVLLFSQLPTLLSVDNGTFSISDAEVAAKCLGVINFLDTDYTDLGSNSVASISAIGLIVKSLGQQNVNNARPSSLWAVLVSRGTPTYTSTTDLVLKFGFVEH